MRSTDGWLEAWTRNLVHLRRSTSVAVTVTLVLVAVASCAHWAHTPRVAGVDRGNDVLVVVFSAEGTVLPGVEASVVYDNGKIARVGVTTELGVVWIEKRHLEGHASVLLFCLEGFTCGAVRPAPGDRGMSAEYTVSLAPSVVR